MKDETKKFKMMIDAEYAHACKKHPKFVNAWFTYVPDMPSVKKALGKYRKENSKQRTMSAYSVLNEEFLEYVEAYYKGNLKHALRELAQCGAVILRMMLMLDKQMKGAKK